MTKFQSRHIFAALLLTTCLFAAAKEDSKPRVVSLSPCLTEIIFLLGKGDCLVGRTNVCDYPEQAKKIPAVGQFGIPNFEKVLQAKPDILVFSILKDRSFATKFQKLGIKTRELPYRTLDDYFKALKTLGGLLNCPKQAAKQIRADMRQLEQFKQDAAKIPFDKRPKVFLALHDSPLMTIGKNSFINDLIEYAGGRNIAGKENRSYFNCSLEWVMRQEPDIILFPGLHKQKVAEIVSSPGWRSLQAVKKGHYYYDFNPDLIYRLGPRIPAGVKALRKYIKKFLKK